MKDKIHRKRVQTFADLEERCAKVNGCLIWEGKTCPAGYPVFLQHGKKTMVRRWAFQRANKYLPELVGDTCGEKLCCNHKHLIPMTYSESQQRARAREVNPELRSMRVAMTMERLGRTKVNRAQADEIRSSSEPGPVLAARYGISACQVNKIKRGEHWPPLGGDTGRLLAGASVFSWGGAAA